MRFGPADGNLAALARPGVAMNSVPSPMLILTSSILIIKDVGTRPVARLPSGPRGRHGASGGGSLWSTKMRTAGGVEPRDDDDVGSCSSFALT
jgi:hypothetical protein